MIDFQFDPEIISKNVLASIAILTVAFIIKIISKLFVSAAVKRIEDEDPTKDTPLERRAYTIQSIANSTFSILIWSLTFIMILAKWGVNITPILTGAGVLGLAIGFGSQTLVKDIVTGFFVLLENQFNIGDKIKIAGLEGTVLEMNLRTTTIVSEDGTRHTIPNSQITTISKLNK